LRVDNNILKLDTVSASYIDRINRPCGTYDIENVIENLCSFNGRLIIQTIFMKGTDTTGTSVDNTGEEYVRPWLEAVRRIAPRQVMIYTIDRETPDSHLQKALPEELDDIADRIKALDIATSVSY
jgi:wyosine [tRNA(Phe)-imidazoG37] synthetase (radical SAM superfamily)